MQKGASVTVLDRAQPGRGATWAAAGMIAATMEAGEADTPEAALARDASSLWPDFAREIEDASGRRIGYLRNGSLLVATGEVEASRFAERARAADDLALLTAAQARAMEPLLADDIHGALFAAKEAQVDNRALGDALARCFVRAGGTLILNEAAMRIESDLTRAFAVRTPYGYHEADAFVLAAGAWSGNIDGLPPDALPPVKPVKGQMLALAPPRGTALPGHVVLGHEAYLVPRGERLLVGATLEDSGFDTALSAAAEDWLSTRALALMPALRDWRIVEHWRACAPARPTACRCSGRARCPGFSSPPASTETASCLHRQWRKSCRVPFWNRAPVQRPSIRAVSRARLRLRRLSLTNTRSGRGALGVAMAYWFLGGGLVLLLFGSDAIVRGGVAISRALNLSPLVIGLLVITAGTSAPEFAVSIQAAQAGSPDIALSQRHRQQYPEPSPHPGRRRRHPPACELAKVVLRDGGAMLIAAAALAAMSRGGEITRTEGMMMLGAFALYIVVIFFSDWRRSAEHSVPCARAVQHLQAGAPSGTAGLFLLLFGFVGLTVGAHFTVAGAQAVAREFHFSEAAVGLTVVAFGASVPELVVTLVAAARRQTHLAIGHLIGSNVFNALGALGVNRGAVSAEGEPGARKRPSGDGGGKRADRAAARLALAPVPAARRAAGAVLCVLSRVRRLAPGPRRAIDDRAGLRRQLEYGAAAIRAARSRRSEQVRRCVRDNAGRTPPHRRKRPRCRNCKARFVYRSANRPRRRRCRARHCGPCRRRPSRRADARPVHEHTGPRAVSVAAIGLDAEFIDRALGIVQAAR